MHDRKDLPNIRLALRSVKVHDIRQFDFKLIFFLERTYDQRHAFISVSNGRIKHGARIVPLQKYILQLRFLRQLATYKNEHFLADFIIENAFLRRGYSCIRCHVLGVEELSVDLVRGNVTVDAVFVEVLVETDLVFLSPVDGRVVFGRDLIIAAVY